MPLKKPKRELKKAPLKSQQSGGQLPPGQVSPQMKPLGILGGGQLARMLALKAHELGVPVAILSEHADDPAAQVTSLWRQGRLDDEKTLTDFIESCSVLTFESEFLDAARLEQISQRTGIPIFPRPRHMAIVQDRLTQKRLLEKYGVPTAPFLAVATPAQARRAFEAFKGQLVFKKRRFGYDGYGTYVVRSPSALEAFLPEIGKNPHGFIAEAFVPFTREAAVMIVRGRRSASLALPFVETFQENSRCLWVKGPLRETPKLKSLGRKLRSLVDKLGYVGVIGVEFFETPQGFLVNELAPRVHNSGHYSLDALDEDQFTLHLKAVLGLELETPSALATGFAMYNLLGQHDEPPKWHLPADVHLHWYGKTENRRGRKMGHINSLDSTPEAALALLRRRRKDFDV